MGNIGASLADQTIVTDDNPRNEDAAKIRSDILKDCSNAVEIGDRAEAIAFGIDQLGDGDALLIAGKGHETTQILGGRVVDFDDAAVVRATIGNQEH